MTFKYSESELNSLEEMQSCQRLGPYLSETNGDLKKAIHLYERNTLLSQAFYRPLQGLEVAFRNTIHNQLTKAFQREDWWCVASIGILKSRQANALLSILERLHEQEVQKQRKLLKLKKKEEIPFGHSIPTPLPGKVVAELSFGFWVGIIGPGYSESLWMPHLHKAFPNTRKSRSECHKPLNKIRLLRNRIAHHEPIFTRNLKYDYSLILEIIGWINEDAARWVRHTSRFEEAYYGTGLEGLLNKYIRKV